MANGQQTTVVQFDSKVHPSFRCFHINNNRACKCEFTHPTHHHGKCKEFTHTNGKNFKFGGDCTDTGRNPVHGGWSGYGSYDACTKSCGVGRQTRTRSCTNPAPKWNGRPCSGSAKDVRPCNIHACPINGGWTAFGKYDACTKSCGGGRQTRTRSCTNPSPDYGGRSCSGATKDARSCNTHACPIDGDWTAFGSYDACTKSCGGGRQTRTRSCTNPSPAHGGRSCSGSTKDTRSCNTHACPVNGGFTAFGSYDACTKSCGGGRQTRTRSCTNPSPANGGRPCSGATKDTRSCNSHACAIDCATRNWNQWTTCSKSCGVGYQRRSRSQTQPKFGGKACPHFTETRRCSHGPCPVHCSVNAFSAWSGCSRSCGTGTQSRSRSISRNAAHGGYVCPYLQETRRCNEHNCPRNGNWGSWGGWGGCNRNCGGGTRYRYRSCNSPSPAYGGRSCPGASHSSSSCNTHSCPIHGNWGRWGGWGGCNRNCGGGTRYRYRSCNNPSPRYGGRSCPGGSSQATSCNTHACPIHGNWGSWGGWGGCNRNCGGGARFRYRSCNNPSPRYGGNHCPGPSSQSTSCNTHSCCSSRTGHRCTCQMESVTWRGPCHTCNAGNCCVESGRFFTCSGSHAGWCHSTGTIQCNGQCRTRHGTCSGGQNRTPSTNGRWGGCNRNCGGGTRTRTRRRSCYGASNGGTNVCPGSSTETQSQRCNTHSCCSSRHGRGCVCGMERFYARRHCGNGRYHCIESGRYPSCRGYHGQCMSRGTYDCSGRCRHRYGSC